MAFSGNTKSPREMKYFRPKSGLEIAVWATFWATTRLAWLACARWSDRSRRVAACALARLARWGGRGVSLALSGGAMYQLPAGLDADACRVRRGDGCRGDARCRVARRRRRRGCCPLLSSSVMTRCARRACDVSIAPPKRTFGLAFITSALCPKPVVSRCTNGTTIRWSNGRVRAPRAARRDRAPWRS
jgi:hypothetical protein